MITMNERVHGDSGNPAFELPPQPDGVERSQEKAMESADNQLDQGAPKPAQTLTQLDPPVVLPVSSVTVKPADDSATLPPVGPMIAQEADRIEKHWVERAKQVIATTKDNPFDQKKQISQMKAEYLKTRFNKLVKTEEETG